MVQHANDNPAEDFWAYALRRLERRKSRVSGVDFGRHLGVLLAGHDSPRYPKRFYRTGREVASRLTKHRSPPLYATYKGRFA